VLTHSPHFPSTSSHSYLAVKSHWRWECLLQAGCLCLWALTTSWRPFSCLLWSAKSGNWSLPTQLLHTSTQECTGLLSCNSFFSLSSICTKETGWAFIYTYMHANMRASIKDEAGPPRSDSLTSLKDDDQELIKQSVFHLTWLSVGQHYLCLQTSVPLKLLSFMKWRMMMMINTEVTVHSHFGAKHLCKICRKSWLSIKYFVKARKYIFF